MQISRRYENFLVFLAPLINSVGGIAIDLYSPSIPSIGRELEATATTMQNTIAVTLIFYAFGQLVFGILSDWWGRRPAVLIGLSVFLAGSAMAAFAHSIETLMIARATQGFAIGSCQVVARAILVDNLRGDRLRVAVVYLSLAFGLGPVVAPYVGGIVEEIAGWRWNFIVYFGYGLVVLSFALVGLRESLRPEARRTPRQTILGYREILTHSQFFAAVTILGASFSAFLLWNVIGPYVVQGRLGHSASFFGSTALCVGVCYLGGTTLNRSLIKRFNGEQLMKGGILLFAIGIALVLANGATLTLVTAVGGIMMIAFAQGFIFSNAMASSMRYFPNRAGAAASLQGCLMLVMGAVASGLISGIRVESNVIIAIAFLCLLAIVVLAFRRLSRLEFQVGR
ncbi:Permeases of the major facilitator superfamily [Paraburkholderia caribensis MBA4]|uniref:Bcr/CflA family efflux transporter n=1 Tax=Paraburkholderia caribensis MBA4 TaxID=1323664 RepID=A0A0P0RGM3_9BURK|nr:multidrug effflux MFS transporter [Paraburkholderia caribensis]ALL67624.1 Permeases of the major facilitator superfamily [Paraburkholderia caribensis MBA4]